MVSRAARRPALHGRFGTARHISHLTLRYALGLRSPLPQQKAWGEGAKWVQTGYARKRSIHERPSPMSTRPAPHVAMRAIVPRHIAIVMDGNGRWARRRGQPRSFGHRAGQKAVRATVAYCLRNGIGVLTLFAFSSENWKRPQTEVGALMDLFMKALDKEIDELHKNEVRVHF